MIGYIVQTTVGLALSFVLYTVFLKKEKSFVFNRFYLLGSILLCLIIPLLQIELNNGFPLVSQVDFNNLIVENIYPVSSPDVVTVQVITKESNYLEWTLGLLYVFVTAVFAFRFLRNLLKMAVLIQQKSVKFDGLKIIAIPNINETFSFFSYLFVDSDLDKTAIPKSIIEHERAHYKQLHSLDIIFTEIVCCFFWFNPFVWLFRQAIIENHEYLADEHVVKSGINIDSYVNKIIQFGNKNQHLFLTSGFSFAKTKNRIIMLHKPKSSNLFRAIKISSIILLFTIGIIVSSFTKPVDRTPFRVVVDAGHGGADTGNSNENEITLSIAKKLLELSENSGVKVILTRSEDKLIGLNKRVEFVNNQKADLLLSLHCDANKDNSVKGISAWYYPKSKYRKSSSDFGKILIEEQLKTNFEEGKIREAGFLMLRNTNNFPSVLLQLGFLSNEVDKALLNDPRGQEQIASSILDGLFKIKESQKIKD